MGKNISRAEVGMMIVIAVSLLAIYVNVRTRANRVDGYIQTDGTHGELIYVPFYKEAVK